MEKISGKTVRLGLRGYLESKFVLFKWTPKGTHFYFIQIYATKTSKTKQKWEYTKSLVQIDFITTGTLNTRFRKNCNFQKFYLNYWVHDQ